MNSNSCSLNFPTNVSENKAFLNDRTKACSIRIMRKFIMKNVALFCTETPERQYYHRQDWDLTENNSLVNSEIKGGQNLKKKVSRR